MSWVLSCESKKQPGFTKLHETGSNKTSEGLRSKSEATCVLVEQGDPKLIALSLKKIKREKEFFFLNISVTFMSSSCFGII